MPEFHTLTLTLQLTSYDYYNTAVETLQDCNLSASSFNNFARFVGLWSFFAISNVNSLSNGLQAEYGWCYQRF